MQALEALGRVTGVFEPDSRLKDGAGSDLAAVLLERMRRVDSLPVLNAGEVLPQACDE